MTAHDSDSTETEVQPPAASDDLEQVVDDLEDRVLGHRVDQERDEDDVPEKPAFEQDLDTDGPAPDAGTGPGAEASS